MGTSSEPQNQDVLFPVPTSRWEKYNHIKQHLGGEPERKVFPITTGSPADFSGVEIIDAYNRKPAKEIGAVRQNMLNGGSVIKQLNSPTHSKTVRSGGRKSPHGSKQNWDSYELGGRIRRLTPTECARLQGFPDNWHEGVSDTQAYKCYGNAVCVPVVRAIMERIR